MRPTAGIVAVLTVRPKINHCSYQTVPQPGLNGRRAYQPRGRCLGGSSAINAMVYVRGHPSNYDDWGRAGCSGRWFDEVLPYFRRPEGNQRGESALRGGHGPLQLSEQQSPRAITEDFVRAGIECGIPRADDFSGAEQEGVGLYQVTQFHGGANNGERCSAATAYLHPVMDRPNLTALTDTPALRVVPEAQCAVAVEVHRDDKTELIRTRREVVTGRTFNSPQLLMLSGVDDPAELGRHGVAAQQALPGVGKNSQHHADFTVLYQSKVTDMFGLGAVGAVKLTKAIFELRRTGKSMIATPFSEGAGFIKSSPELSRPDLQLHFVISIVDNQARKLPLGYGFSCHVCVLRPHARGEARLTDASAASTPRIDAAFLPVPQKVALPLQGVKNLRQILRAPALARYRHREVYTTHANTAEELIRHMRTRTDSIYHPVGTGKMSVDAMAVVDPQLRVHGITALRVVDASVMPTLIGANTNADHRDRRARSRLDAWAHHRRQSRTRGAGCDDPRTRNCPGSNSWRGASSNPCNRSIRHLAAMRPMASVGCATVLRPGPISEAHSGSSKPTKPNCWPNCQPSRDMAAATRSVTTALPASTAARRSGRARCCNASSAASSPSTSRSALSNTVPAVRPACAATNSRNAAPRSSRELTPVAGSVT